MEDGALDLRDTADGQGKNALQFGAFQDAGWRALFAVGDALNPIAAGVLAPGEFQTLQFHASDFSQPFLVFGERDA